MKEKIKKIVCHWEEGSNICYIGKKYPPLDVVAKKYNKTVKERESLGNGWYGASVETRVVQATDWLVYYEGSLIGEISMYNVMFQKPTTWHLLVKESTELPLIQTINHE